MRRIQAAGVQPQLICYRPSDWLTHWTINQSLLMNHPQNFRQGNLCHWHQNSGKKNLALKKWANIWKYYCKTLIIRETLFSRSHLQWFIHEILVSRFAISSSIILTYWRGFYFRISLLSRIYAKIKSSRIKSVLQYLNKAVKWIIVDDITELCYSVRV